MRRRIHTRRVTLSPQRQATLLRADEQECISNTLLFGVAETVKRGYLEVIEIDTCIAQLNEAKLHTLEAKKLYDAAYHPRKYGKKRGKK